MSLARVRRGGRQRLGGKGRGASPVRQVRLSDDLNTQLEAVATAEGKSASEVMREAITERLAQFNRETVCDDPVVVYDVLLEEAAALEGVLASLSRRASSTVEQAKWRVRMLKVRRACDEVNYRNADEMLHLLNTFVQRREDLTLVLHG